MLWYWTLHCVTLIILVTSVSLVLAFSRKDAVHKVDAGCITLVFVACRHDHIVLLTIEPVEVDQAILIQEVTSLGDAIYNHISLHVKLCLGFKVRLC